jgi:hypothetical protein
MKTPKKPTNKNSENLSEDENGHSDQPVDSKSKNKFVDEEEDEFDLPIDDLGGLDDFNDFDDDEDF